jgi:hypothetical protein
MKTGPPLQVEAIDCLSHSHFVVYLSDGTYVAITAEKLAECFPERKSLPPSSKWKEWLEKS